MRLARGGFFRGRTPDCCGRSIRAAWKTASPGLSLLDAAQVRNLEPNLSPEVVGALYAPTAAIVNPWEYALALAETAVRNGVSLHLNAGVTAIRRCEGGFELDTAAGRFWARYVLNAAGLYSDEVHNMAARARPSASTPTGGNTTCSTKARGSGSAMSSSNARPGRARGRWWPPRCTAT